MTARACSTGAEGAADIHVWYWRLDGDPTFEWAWLEAVLDDDERRHAQRRKPHLRRRYVVAHGVLRLILSQACGVDAKDLAILRDPCRRCGQAHGKPRLERGGVRFNLSHSADYALVGLATREVGVDIERVRSDYPIDEVGARFGLQPPAVGGGRSERARHFFSCWTQKEAVVKATGEGLTRHPDSFTIEPAAPRPSAVLDGVEWGVDEVPAPRSYVAAVATEGRSWAWSAGELDTDATLDHRSLVDTWRTR